jgi:hypothetical protein
MMVTEGGGAGAAGEAVLFCWDGGGAPASFCAWDAAADKAARLTAINVNKDLARISSPEIFDRKAAWVYPATIHAQPVGLAALRARTKPGR